MSRLVSQQDLKHELEVSTNSWYIKLYLKAWSADKSEITFCKLFWGYIFMWLAAIAHLAFFLKDQYLKTSYAKRQLRKRKEWEAGQPERIRAELKAKAEKAVDSPSKVLAFIENVMAKIGMVLRHKIVNYLFIVLAIAVCIASVALFVVIMVLQPLVVAACVGGLIVATGLLILLIVILDHIMPTATKGFRTFGHVIKGGFIAVKTNTCPRITLK